MPADLVEHETGKFSRAVYVKGGSGDPSVKMGTVGSVAGAPTFTIASLAGAGNDYYVGWYAYVVWDKGGAGAAPQGESKVITDYVSSTGTFSHAAFTAALEAGDKVLVSLSDPNVSWGTATLANQNTIIADTEKLYDVSFGASPAAGSLASFIASGGLLLGTTLPIGKSLYDGISGNINAVDRVAGKTNVKTISVTAAANAAADTTLGTVTTQGCIIQGVVIHADAPQTAHLTSCPVHGGASEVLTFISSADAIRANLDAENKQVGWDGEVYLPTGSTIVMVHNGSGTDALNLTVTIRYMSTVNGGYLS